MCATTCHAHAHAVVTIFECGLTSREEHMRDKLPLALDKRGLCYGRPSEATSSSKRQERERNESTIGSRSTVEEDERATVQVSLSSNSAWLPT